MLGFTLSDVVNIFVLGILKATCKSLIAMRLGKLPIVLGKLAMHAPQFQNVPLAPVLRRRRNVTVDLTSALWRVNLMLVLSRSFLLGNRPMGLG